MTLSAGIQLGPYEILAPIGAGGMGEVYRATDTRLRRTVAVKVLPAGFADDPGRRQRFEREARVISGLNHPHICTLHDIGSHNGIDFLVMEYLEGETLAQRLQRGALPLEQALAIAGEIADAVDKAHRSGVVHRDLKPGNIMLTPSGAKLLDFGLATRAPALGPPASSALTASADLTAEGVIVGTLQYMAPEVLAGKESDARSDLFSLGAMIYEMVGGARPFQGSSRADLIAAILKEDPQPLASGQEPTPPLLDRVVRRCLAKDPQERWQSTADLRAQLAWIAEGVGAAPARQARASGRRQWLWLGAGVLAGAAVGAAALWPLRPALPAAPGPAAQFAIRLPGNESLHEYASASLVLSEDGRTLAYVANRDDTRGIYLRELERLEPRWLDGSEGATNPFFSPDGRFIAFVVGNSLRRLSLEGGSPPPLADAPYFSGATWLPDDSIVFAPVFTSGLFRIPGQGGTPARVSTPDTAQGESGHLWPHALPGGNAVLFTIWTGATMDQSQIGILEPGRGPHRVLIQGGFHARYAPSGHIVFVRGSTLMAAPFDIRSLQVTGPAVPALEGVRGDRATGAVQFDISHDGSLVYGPGKVSALPRRLVWVDRSGVRQNATDQQRAFLSARFSPDGRRLALTIEEEATSIWVYEPSRGTMSRVTYGSDDHSAAWSPDGRRIAFESSRSSLHQIYITQADGGGTPEQVTSKELEHYLGDWSPDGRSIAYTEFHPVTGADIWLSDAEAEHAARPFLATPFSERKPAFSTDGRWLAYVSNESGQDEVYVQRFPDGGGKQQVSSGGGDEPAWGRDGRELYYRNGARMMAVPLSETETLDPGKPSLLFRGLYFSNVMPSRSYGVAPDGRFVMVEAATDAAARDINVVLNWSEGLRRLMPAR